MAVEDFRAFAEPIKRRRGQLFFGVIQTVRLSVTQVD
jgi:hypothetical protein